MLDAICRRGSWHWCVLVSVCNGAIATAPLLAQQLPPVPAETAAAFDGVSGINAGTHKQWEETPNAVPASSKFAPRAVNPANTSAGNNMEPTSGLGSATEAGADRSGERIPLPPPNDPTNLYEFISLATSSVYATVYGIASTGSSSLLRLNQEYNGEGEYTGSTSEGYQFSLVLISSAPFENLDDPANGASPADIALWQSENVSAFVCSGIISTPTASVAATLLMYHTPGAASRFIILMTHSAEILDLFWNVHNAVSTPSMIALDSAEKSCQELIADCYKKAQRDIRDAGINLAACLAIAAAVCVVSVGACLALTGGVACLVALALCNTSAIACVGNYARELALALAHQRDCNQDALQNPACAGCSQPAPRVYSRLTPPCPADFDNNGFIDFEDFDAFVCCFATGSPCGDFNRDGFLDFVDFDSFVAAFETGC